MQYQSGAVSPVGSIQEGWEIIKNDYWTFFLMTLVAGVIIIAAAMILGGIQSAIAYAIAGALGMATQNGGQAAQISAAILPEVISQIIGIFTNIIVLTVSGALFCGIYAALARKTSTGTAEFGDLFSGFQKIQACLIVAVVISLVQFVIGMAVLLVGAALGVSAVGLGALTADGQVNTAAVGGIILVALVLFLVSLIVNLIVSALTTFVYPLIGDRNLSGMEALTTSIKSGLGNLGGLILLLILLILMAIGGVLVCFVGILFVAPIMSAAIFAAYQSVFGRSVGNDSYRYTPPQPPTFGQQPGY